MAVCNFFKSLSKTTGTFLTFSQYMEDLTAWQTMNKYYKIVPSRFIALDLQGKLVGKFDNISLPTYLYERFENACACFKNVPSFSSSWKPEYSKRLFWDALLDEDNGIFSIDDFQSVVQYMGDINIQSYDNVNGTGYSEIYCYIPNDASAYNYKVSKASDNVTSNITRNAGISIEGCPDIKLSKTYTYTLNNKYDFSWSNPTKKDASSYNIDCIIVLYDVYSDNTIEYTDIPMGVYFTGLIDEEGRIQNSITKYVSNEDIYNSGTSYGLRICTRYATAGDLDKYDVQEVTYLDNHYGDLTRVLSQVSISQNKMDEVVKKTTNVDQNYKQLLSIFKNSQTNVPYIKSVNGKDYWFVNGKLLNPVNLSPITNNSDNSNSYYPNYIYESNASQNDLLIEADIKTSNGGKTKKYLLNAFEMPEAGYELDITYDIKYQNVSYTDISQMSFQIIDEDGNVETISQATKEYKHTLTDINTPHTYQFKLGYNGQIVWSPILSYQAIYPSYFGHSSIGSSSEIKDIIDGGLKTSLLDIREQSYIVEENPNSNHLYFIYPKIFGELKSITDEKGYNYISDFTKYDKKYNGVDYLLYMDEKGTVSVNNKEIHFR